MGAASPRIVTLLTDFGLADEYVAVMKGEILRRCPHATVVDISHAIEAGDITRGALALAAAVAHFPPATVHVAVVDPGVGSQRRALLIECRDYLLLGPDNGLLSLAMASAGEAPAQAFEQAFELDRPEFFNPRVGATFHGRDVFAPVAGHLAAGLAPSQAGSPISDVHRLRLPRPRTIDDGLVGEVLYADRFGNLITNIERGDVESLGADVSVALGDIDVGPLRRTYSDASRGESIAVIGSTDRLELAVVEGSAAERFGVQGGSGESVRVGTRRS